MKTPNILLACGDWVIYSPPPYLADVVFCRKCRTFQTVVGGTVMQNQVGKVTDYKYKCICRECDYARTGSHLGKVTTLGETHALRNSHLVDIVTRHGEWRGTLGPAIEGFTDEPGNVIES